MCERGRQERSNGWVKEHSARCCITPGNEWPKQYMHTATDWDLLLGQWTSPSHSGILCRLPTERHTHIHTQKQANLVHAHLTGTGWHLWNFRFPPDPCDVLLQRNAMNFFIFFSPSPASASTPISRSPFAFPVHFVSLFVLFLTVETIQCLIDRCHCTSCYGCIVWTIPPPLSPLPHKIHIVDASLNLTANAGKCISLGKRLDRVFYM